MIIDFAKQSELNQVIALWQEVFGDERGFIRQYLDDFFVDGCSLAVVRDGDRIVSMLNLMEFNFRESNLPTSKCGYIYAAATHPEYRSKGLMSDLIEFVLQAGRVRGYAMVFLIPAENSLFDYYKSRGFTDAFWQCDFVAPTAERNCVFGDFDLTDDVQWECFYNAYTEYTANQPLAIIKDKVFFDHSMREYFMGGGQVDAVIVNDMAAGYLLYRDMEDKVRIEQFIPLDPAFDVRGLSSLFTCDVTFRCDHAIMQQLGIDGTPVRFGMMYPLTDTVAKMLQYTNKTLYISGFGEEY